MRFCALFVVLAAACFLGAAEQGDEPSLHAKRAQAAILRNDKDAALRELKELLRLDPGNINGLGSLGMVEFTSGQYEAAARHFEEALSRSPSLWNARAFLGICEIRLGRTEQGRELLGAAYAHVTDKNLRVQAGLELAKLLAAEGLLEKAVPIIETLQQTAPDNPEVQYSIYRLHSEIAAAALRKLALMDTDSVWVHEILGQNFMAQEQYASAIEEYRKALNRDPRAPGLHFQLGQALFLQARLEENRAAAEKEFAAELEINPLDADSFYKLGQIALERADPAKAKADFLRALALRPGLADAHADLAKVLSDAGDRHGAIEHLEVAAKLAPDTKNTHYRLAQLYRAEGRTADADREFDLFRKLSAAELTPHQP